ncbi:MAG: DUF4190 domain-containing protein [Phycisphaerales bacterium JB037]
MNTYAQPQYADFGEPGPMRPVRTSSLAVASLILGIVCLPGLGVLAVLIGVIALFAIRASAGRVSGAGLAAGGIVMGLIATTLWVMVVFGVAQFAKMGATQADRTLAAIEARDLDALRAQMTPDAAALLSQDRLDAFADEMASQLGAPGDSAASVGAMLSQLGGLQPAQDRLGSPRLTDDMTAFPVPVQFENKRALVMLVINIESGDLFSTGLEGTIVNVAIATNDGTLLWLMDQQDVFNSLLGRSTPPEDANRPDEATPNENAGENAGRDPGGAGGDGGGN